MNRTISFGILFFLVFSGNIQGQNWFLDSTYVWTEVFSCFSIPPYAITSRYTMDRNPVTISDKTYYEALVSSLEFGEDYHGTGKFLRTDDSNRVYLFTEGAETLLYDFNLQVGDTFYVNNSFGIVISVASVDTITLENGELRKRWILDCNGSNEGYFMIEGIGIPYGLLDYSNVCLIDGCGTSLLCMMRNDTLLYDNPFYDSCWMAAVATEDLAANEIFIFPNPALKEISIISKDLIIQNAFVIDLLGNNVFIGNSSPFDISFLQAGYYFMRIELENGQIAMKRFVKQ